MWYLALTTEIKILGFQSPDKLYLQDNIKHSYFIYPDETVRSVKVLLNPDIYREYPHLHRPAPVMPEAESACLGSVPVPHEHVPRVLPSHPAGRDVHEGRGPG